MSVDVFMNIKNENDLKNYFEVVKVFQDGSTKAQSVHFWSIKDDIAVGGIDLDIDMIAKY